MKPTPPDPGPLLAFGAHPDDIEFGCGGIIALEAAAGRRIHFVIGSKGESATNGTPRQRVAEARRSAALLGATLEFVELGSDAHMEASVARTLRLAAIIRRIRPSIVLAPTTVENQHPDHIIVGRLVRDAARLARFGGVKELKKQPRHVIDLLLNYAVSVEAEPRDIRPVLVDMSSPQIVATWTAAMEAHASQMRTRNYVELQLARARVNGLRIGREHAMAVFPADPLVVDSLAALGRSARHF